VSYRDECDQLATNVLRQLVTTKLTNGQRNVIHTVLDRREKIHQKGYDAGQVLLDVLGGYDVQELHDRAIEAAQRASDTKKFTEAEQSQGVADALWEYIQDRSDT